MPNVQSIWQLRLHNHFEALAAKGISKGRPIFAIEHGLNSTEITALLSDAREDLHSNGLNPSNWLMWVVYATEYGYNFDGHKFWEDFSDQTPYWYSKGDRNKIRDWFQKFKRQYGGIEPRGDWAHHYSIISWPVTHSILPKDLQRFLAHSLYIGQWALNRVKDGTYEEIGRALAKTVQRGSRRYFLFLEQTELVGQIVVSLLDNTNRISDGIETTILSRIRQDLSCIRDAQDWIKQAQKTWESDRPRFKVIGSMGSLDKWSTASPNTPLETQSQISLTPLVEAKQFAKDVWAFEITVPSFTEVAALSSEYHEFLRKTRVSLPAAEALLCPGNWLLIGVRKKTLKSWPLNGEGLLEFETTPPFEGLINWNLSLQKTRFGYLS